MFKVSTLCYLIRDDKVLFIHKKKKTNDINFNKYIGLGGKVEENETPEECVIREVKEESGLDIIPKLRGIVSFPLKHKTSLDTSDYWMSFLYIATSWKGEITYSSEEGDLKWVKKVDITKLNLWEGDKIFLKELFNYDRFFTLDLVYKNSKLMKSKLIYI